MWSPRNFPLKRQVVLIQNQNRRQDHVGGFYDRRTQASEDELP
jgi:hypothetical protein